MPFERVDLFLSNNKRHPVLPVCSICRTTCETCSSDSIQHKFGYPPIITVASPFVIVFGGPTASSIVSPIRAAGKFATITVAEGVMTIPGPCGGIGKGVRHAWMSDPPAADEIALPMVAAAVAFTVSSANFAAGAPGVPAAATVAASATFIAASETAFAACIAAATAGFTPRHAGRKPIKTVMAVGPPVSIGGNGWATVSVTRAAGGIFYLPY
jgi:hypothetical protein